MQERVIEVLKTVFDPEIPVNIYDLGLIYRIELNEDNTELSVDMTLTAPSKSGTGISINTRYEEHVLYR